MNNNTRKKRILFITLSCVGDAVMTTPVLESIHELYPDAVIDIVADQRSSVLFSRCPYLGAIIHKHKDKVFRGALDLLKQLRPNYYELIVDLRTDGLAYLFRGRRRLTKWQARSYGPHSTEQQMGVIRNVHGDKPIPPTKVWLDKEHESFSKEVIAQLPPGNLLVVGPASGAKEPEKTWLPENYSSLINKLGDLFSGVILVGSGNDREMTAKIASRVSLPLLDQAGQTDLLQVAAVLERASMFVGSDSGLGHIAAAMGAPTLSLFSNADPQTYLPWGSNVQWLMGVDRDARKIPLTEVETKVRQMI